MSYRDDDERRRYDGDVAYEVWRSGRNPDNISNDRVSDHWYRGDSAESAAAHEIRIQRQGEESRRDEEAQDEAEYYRQQEEEHYRRMAEDDARAQAEQAAAEGAPVTPPLTPPPEVS